MPGTRPEEQVVGQEHTAAGEQPDGGQGGRLQPLVPSPEGTGSRLPVQLEPGQDPVAASRTEARERREEHDASQPDGGGDDTEDGQRAIAADDELIAMLEDDDTPADERLVLAIDRLKMLASENERLREDHDRASQYATNAHRANQVQEEALEDAQDEVLRLQRRVSELERESAANRDGALQIKEQHAQLETKLGQRRRQRIELASQEGGIKPSAYYISGRGINGDLVQIERVGTDEKRWVIRQHGRNPLVLQPQYQTLPPAAGQPEGARRPVVTWIPDYRGEDSPPAASLSLSEALAWGDLIRGAYKTEPVLKADEKLDL